jgi:predicted transcriptional regulator
MQKERMVAIAKLRRRRLSSRKIAARLNIPEGSIFAVIKGAKRNGSYKPLR